VSIPERPWTAEETARRDRILAAARARGIPRRRLVEVGELGKGGDVRMSKWARGRAHVDDAALERMEAFLAQLPGSVPATVSGAVAAPMSDDELCRALVERSALCGVPEPTEKDELRALAKASRRSAVGSILRLMVSARSEQVQLRAAQEILERADGKAVQAIVDLTPKPPVTNEELIAKLERLMAGDAPPPESDDDTDAGNA
jgi:hypothetical protein